MPAFSIPLDGETQAQMGNFKEAAKAVEREWKDVQKQILKDIAGGRSVSKDLAAQALKLRERADTYSGKADQKAQLEKAAKESVTKTLADLTNAHNPHGKILQVLRGNVNANTFGQMGGGLKHLASDGKGALAAGGRLAAAVGGSLELAAAVVSGPAMLAGLGARAIFDVMQQRADDQRTAAEIENAGAGRSFAAVKALRYNTDRSTTRDLKARAHAYNSTTADHYGIINEFFSGHTNAAHAKEYARDTADFKARMRGRDSTAAGIADYRSNLFSGAVEHKLGLIEKGTLSWLKSVTVDWLSGARDAERAQLAMEMSRKQMAGRERMREAYKHGIEENPVYKLAQIDRARQLHAWESFQIERFQQWNPY